VKATWFVVIHDLTPTNFRLHKIGLTPSDKGKSCGAVDTEKHRITDCGEGPRIWNWSAQRIAKILQTDESHISPDWLLRPDCVISPSTRRLAVLWILAHAVHYQITLAKVSKLTDCITYVCTSQQSLLIPPAEMAHVGDYLFKCHR
jgi:hypothetical protein